MNKNMTTIPEQSTAATPAESMSTNQSSAAVSDYATLLSDTISPDDPNSPDYQHLRNYVLYNVILSILARHGIELDDCIRFPGMDFDAIYELSKDAEAKAYPAIDFADVVVEFIHRLSYEQKVIYRTFSETGLFKMNSGENEECLWFTCLGRFDLPWEFVLNKAFGVLDGQDRKWVIYVLKNWHLFNNAPISMREHSDIDPTEWKIIKRSLLAKRSAPGRRVYYRIGTCCELALKQT